MFVIQNELTETFIKPLLYYYWGKLHHNNSCYCFIAQPSVLCRFLYVPARSPFYCFSVRA